MTNNHIRAAQKLNMTPQRE